MANANVFAQANEMKKDDDASVSAMAKATPPPPAPKNEMGGREVKVEDARSNSTLIAAVRAALGHLESIPKPDQDPDVYRDWGDEEEFKAKVGKGECAGP